MTHKPVPDRRRERHLAKRRTIIDAAWALARDEGLAGLSLRELARRVGLRQPSLYSYFESKLDLYDAMFEQGNQLLVDRMLALDLPDDPRKALKVFAREFLEFDIENPPRSELMLQRTIPGFEPSPEAYAVAVKFDEFAWDVLRRAGVRSRAQRDVFAALISGLGSAQRANDPGGQRWVRNVDWTVDMFLREVDRQAKGETQ